MDEIPLATRVSEMSPVPHIATPAAGPIELDYSRADAALAGQMVGVFDQLLVVGVLSGLCVGSCFLILAQWTLGSVVHAGVYAAILIVGTRAGLRMSRCAADVPAFHSPARVVLDLVAACGLLLIGFGPVVRNAVAQIIGASRRPGPTEDWEAGALGVAFLLLALSTYRHLPQYRGLASVMTLLGRPKMSRWLRVLGMFKFIFETVWLVCCTVPLLSVVGRIVPRGTMNEDTGLYFAVAAFIGVLVYGVLWFVTVVTHGQCCTIVRRAATIGPTPLSGPAVDRVGFDVLSVEAATNGPAGH